MSDLDSAVIKREFGDVVRDGRGFSLSELTNAGINPFHARHIGLRVDRLRKSTHQENVERLAPFAKKIKEEILTKKKIESASPQAETSTAEAKPEKKKTKERKSIRLRRTKKKD